MSVICKMQNFLFVSRENVVNMQPRKYCSQSCWKVFLTVKFKSCWHSNMKQSMTPHSQQWHLPSYLHLRLHKPDKDYLPEWLTAVRINHLLHGALLDVIITVTPRPHSWSLTAASTAGIKYLLSERVCGRNSLWKNRQRIKKRQSINEWGQRGRVQTLVQLRSLIETLSALPSCIKKKK